MLTHISYFFLPLAPGADTEKVSVAHNPRLLDAPAVASARLVVVVTVTITNTK